MVIGGDSGAPPRFAVPDFVALTPESAEIAKVITQVLWDDLNFEREFYLIPATPTPPCPRRAPPSSWPLRRGGNWAPTACSSARCSGPATRWSCRCGCSTCARGRPCSPRSTPAPPRTRGSTRTRSADEIHLQQRALKGVARTKLAFASDRTRVRADGPVANRETKEIYVSDYDGGNQQRITNTRQLNSYPSWSADSRAVAYTSYRRIVPDIFISRIYEGILENPLKGGRDANYLPSISQDGSRIAFMSNRDGNPEIYVMNVNGSNIRRLTNHPAGDSSPTFSPTGTQIAFTSDRAGQPQVYVMSSTDGTGLRKLTSESYADRPTWAPTGLNEIAFTAGTASDYDIKVLDLASGAIRQITSGAGLARKPGVFTQRPPPGVHHDARWPHAGVHHRPRWPWPAAGHHRRQQLFPAWSK